MKAKKKTKRIVVTARDIAAASPGQCDGCPIALAATRAFKTPARYYAGPYLKVGDLSTNNARNFLVPIKCMEFANAFDAESPVKPFSFTVEL